MATLPTSMKDVALRAGVSVMTVSRVLRNSPQVSEETRLKVVAAAEAVGYRPNPLVGAWMAHMRSSSARVASHQTLAFVTTEETREGWRDSLTTRYYLEGASARADQLGFRLEHFWLGEPGMTGGRMSRILRARGIAGLLLAPLPLPVRTVDLEWQDFAAVAFGYSMRTPNLHRVTNHQIHTIRLALEESYQFGYRRIGLALERSKDARVDHNWTTGFLPYQASIPPADRVSPFLPDRLTREELLLWVRECRPDIILGGRQDIIHWLRADGWRVPEDLGFVSLEYYPEHGPLAGIDQNSLTVGAAAVELVVEKLYHNDRGIPEKPKVVMIEGRWQPGQTVLQRTQPGTGKGPPRSCDEAVSWKNPETLIR